MVKSVTKKTSKGKKVVDAIAESTKKSLQSPKHSVLKMKKKTLSTDCKNPQLLTTHKQPLKLS